MPWATWLAAPIRIVLRSRGEAAIVRSPSTHSATRPRPTGLVVGSATRSPSASTLRRTRMPATSTADRNERQRIDDHDARQAAQRDGERRRAASPTRRAMFWLTALRAFAAASWPGATRLGTSASVAGPHSLASIDWPAATR